MSLIEYKIAIAALIEKGSNVYRNGDEILDEEGNKIDIIDEMKFNDWRGITNHLVLGKCGEFYAQYILDMLGYNSFEALVDDHGVDLIACMKNIKGTCIRVQVKTVKSGNYTFIRKKNKDKKEIDNAVYIDENYYVMYIRVLDEGNPRAYFFPMNRIVKILKDEDDASYMCFVNHEYYEKKSDPEYGISSADRYFKHDSISQEFISEDTAEYYCVADGWEVMGDRFQSILDMNNYCDK